MTEQRSPAELAAEALARKLTGRIQAVLRGDLTPTPVGALRA